MKIAILGTRGIPNRYGGFEQCAEKVAQYWKEKGHDVTVYSPPGNPYTKELWKGVKIKKIFFKESKLEFLNLFFYDFLSLKDAVNRDFDIILELGYSPCALFYYLKKKKVVKIVTNMDGFEWKRSKWNYLIKKFLKFTERLAVKKSDALVSDNPVIRDYILDRYGLFSYYIPYGAELVKAPNEKDLVAFNVKKYMYYLMITRLEPENNIEVALDGYLKSESSDPFLIIGPNTNKYSKVLRKKYQYYERIRFLGGIYDIKILTVLRWFSKIYFHGHSVGGTNPSLLDAMSSYAYIASHDNTFNRNVIGINGIYFSNKQDILSIIKNYKVKDRMDYTVSNRKVIEQYFTWDAVSDIYLKLFKELV